MRRTGWLTPCVSYRSIADTNPLFAIDSLTFDRILEWLLKFVECRIADLYPADDGTTPESDIQLAVPAAPASNPPGATEDQTTQNAAGTPPVLIILSHSDEQIKNPVVTSASAPLSQQNDSDVDKGAQLPLSSHGGIRANWRGMRVAEARVRDSHAAAQRQQGQRRSMMGARERNEEGKRPTARISI